MAATTSPKTCPSCGADTYAKTCPACGSRTVPKKNVQEAADGARASSRPKKGEHDCPRCHARQTCAVRHDFPVREAKAAPPRICAPCGAATASAKCPECGRKTIAPKVVAKAARAAEVDAGLAPAEFPEYGDALADQLHHKCGSCGFLFACEKQDASAAAAEVEP